MVSRGCQPIRQLHGLDRRNTLACNIEGGKCWECGLQYTIRYLRAHRTNTERPPNRARGSRSTSVHLLDLWIAQLESEVSVGCLWERSIETQRTRELSKVCVDSGARGALQLVQKHIAHSVEEDVAGRGEILGLVGYQGQLGIGIVRDATVA